MKKATPYNYNYVRRKKSEISTARKTGKNPFGSDSLDELISGVMNELRINKHYRDKHLSGRTVKRRKR